MAGAPAGPPQMAAEVLRGGVPGLVSQLYGTGLLTPPRFTIGNTSLLPTLVLATPSRGVERVCCCLLCGEGVRRGGEMAHTHCGAGVDCIREGYCHHACLGNAFLKGTAADKARWQPHVVDNRDEGMPEKHSALHGLAMGLSVTANPDGTYSQAAVEEISQRLPITSLTIIPGVDGIQPGSNIQRVSQLYFTHIVGDGEESEGKVGQLKFACTTACRDVCVGIRERP